jgi:predicted phosphoribosyltransferase
MFRDRIDAALKLADRLKGRPMVDLLVLAIPRGGVVTGAVVARELGADLDVILSRKLRAPMQPELALGAIAEGGGVYLEPDTGGDRPALADYLADERGFQVWEIAGRAKLFRRGRPPAAVAGRTVILTDDGIATGSTMIAALLTLRRFKPRELIVAVPIAPPHSLAAVRRLCDEAACLLVPETFWAVGQVYQDFGQVTDEEVIQLLKASGHRDRDKTNQPVTI